MHQRQPAAPARAGGATAPLDVTNRFLLAFADGLGGERVLDYGCGAGRLVAAGRSQGMDMSGVDVFYGGSADRDEAEAAGLLGSHVREMTDGTIPFDDETFDVVVNNQVMEHVDDLDATLADIHRVLAPGGTLLSLFPSKDVWREGHIGIPLSHRLPRHSRVRFAWTWALRTAGLGIFKGQGLTRRQWATEKLEWIDRWTHYRTRREIFDTYDRLFTSELAERDYIRFRLGDRPSGPHGLLLRTLDWPLTSRIEIALFRKLAFLVIVSRRREPTA